MPVRRSGGGAATVWPAGVNRTWGSRVDLRVGVLGLYTVLRRFDGPACADLGVKGEYGLPRDRDGDRCQLSMSTYVGGLVLHPGCLFSESPGNTSDVGAVDGDAIADEVDPLRSDGGEIENAVANKSAVASGTSAKTAEAGVTTRWAEVSAGGVCAAGCRRVRRGARGVGDVSCRGAGAMLRRR